MFQRAWEKYLVWRTEQRHLELIATNEILRRLPQRIREQESSWIYSLRHGRTYRRNMASRLEYYQNLLETMKRRRVWYIKKLGLSEQDAKLHDWMMDRVRTCKGRVWLLETIKRYELPV